MYQYFKRQLKNSDMFRILWDPSSGSINSASLKLLVMFCVRSRRLAAWNLDLWCVFLVQRVENYC